MKKLLSIILPLALLLSACGDPENNGGTQNSNQNGTINSNNNNNGPANNNNNGNPSNTTPGTPATVTKVVHKGGEGWRCSEIHPCDEGLKCVLDDPIGLDPRGGGTCQKVERCETSADCASSSLGNECLHITLLPEKEGTTVKPPQRERTCGKCSEFAMCGDLSKTCVLGPDLRTGTCEPVCSKDADCTDPKKPKCDWVTAVTPRDSVCVEANKLAPGDHCDANHPDRQCMDGFVCAVSKAGDKTGVCTQVCNTLGDKSPDCSTSHADRCLEGEVAESGDNKTVKLCWPSRVPHYSDSGSTGPTTFADLGEECSLDTPCDHLKSLQCIGTTIFPSKGVCKLKCNQDDECTSKDPSLKKCGEKSIPAAQKVFKAGRPTSYERFCE